MDSFCGSPFWDSNITWNTNSPRFTPCFEKTILVWIPSAFLSLFSAVQIYSALKLQKGKVPFSVLGLVQEGIPKILVIIEIVDFSFTFRKSDDPWFKIYPADQAEPIIKGVTFGLALFLEILTKRKGIQSSAVLFIFWLLTAVCALPEFLSEFRSVPLEGEYHNHKIHSILTQVGYPVIVLQLILHFFADKAPKPPLHDNKSDKQEETTESKRCPQKSSSFPNQFTFQWMYPLLWKGYKKGLQFSDLWDLNEEDKPSLVTGKFNKYWNPELERVKQWNSANRDLINELSHNEENNGEKNVKKRVQKKTASILPALWKSNWYIFIMSGILRLVQDLLQFVSPVFLSLLISHLGGRSYVENWKGYLFMGTLFATVTLQTIFSNYETHLTLLIGMRLRCALVGAVYQKSLIISNKARKESTVGEIVNLMSVDTQRFQDCMNYFHQIWSAPLQILLALYFLWGHLGVATISGTAILVILIPINAKVVGLLRNLRIEQMKKKDERVRLINEVLSGIKVLKLYAWEPSFEERVKDIRQMELDILRRIAFINAIANSFWFTAPLLVSLASFATFVLLDESNVLDAEKTFVSLTLFNIMRLPMGLCSTAIGQLVQTHVSLNRINKFMNSDEIKADTVSHDYLEHGKPISVEEQG